MEHIQPLTFYIAQTLNLPKFPAHANTFYGALSGFTVLHILAPYLSRLFFPNVYPKLPRRVRYSWTVHVVSMVHASVVAPWALYLATQSVPAVDNDRAFGWDARIGELHAVTCAYFLWDTFETIFSGAGIEFVLHGALTLLIYGSGFRPWIVYYGPRALIWELSTPLLNIHWFLDKAGKTGSTFQLVNGLLLLIVFFSARMVYGAVISVEFLQTLWTQRHGAYPALTITVALGNLALNALNWIWFGKMIAAMRKRFTGAPKKGESEANANGKVVLDGQDLFLPEKDVLKSAKGRAFVSKNEA